MRRDPIDLSSGLDMTWPAEQERNSCAPVVRAALALLQPGGKRLLRGAVVRQEDDDSMLGKREGIQFLQQAVEVLIELLDHAVDTGSPLGQAHLAVRFDPLLVHIERPVGHVRG